VEITPANSFSTFALTVASNIVPLITLTVFIAFGKPQVFYLFVVASMETNLTLNCFTLYISTTTLSEFFEML